MLRPTRPQRAARRITLIQGLPGGVIDHRARLELAVLFEAVHCEVIARIERHTLRGHVAALPLRISRGCRLRWCVGFEADSSLALTAR